TPEARGSKPLSHGACGRAGLKPAILPSLSRTGRPRASIPAGRLGMPSDGRSIPDLSTKPSGNGRRASANRIRERFFSAPFRLEASYQRLALSAREVEIPSARRLHHGRPGPGDSVGGGAMRPLRARAIGTGALARGNPGRCAARPNLSGAGHGWRLPAIGGAAPGTSAVRVLGSPDNDRVTDD